MVIQMCHVTCEENIIELLNYNGQMKYFTFCNCMFFGVVRVYHDQPSIFLPCTGQQRRDLLEEGGVDKFCRQFLTSGWKLHEMTDNLPTENIFKGPGGNPNLDDYFSWVTLRWQVLFLRFNSIKNKFQVWPLSLPCWLVTIIYSVLPTFYPTAF